MKALQFWPVLLVIVLADILTKTLAVTLLPPSGVPQSLVGDVVRLVLVYNPGAAFGLYLGEYSRWIFMALTGVALFILWRLYRQTESGDLARTLAIAFVTSGAIGNLVDRVRSELGVVDFIDIGFGTHRWPTFNIADMAVSGGAVMLAWVLWSEDKRAAALAAASVAPLAVPLSATPASGSSGTPTLARGDAGEHS